METDDPSAGIGTRPARLLLNPPGIGQTLQVFGYPPGRPDGVWATATVAGRVGNGRLQLDCDPDAAWRVQPGFSGSPVLDPTTGRVAGIIASAAPTKTEGRDSYAITADRLRLAWPQVLDPHYRTSPSGRLPVGTGDPRCSASAELTVLHLSDPQFTGDRPLDGEDPGDRAANDGTLPEGRVRDALFGLLHDDLETLAVDHGLRPDLVVVTGDLAASGLPSQYAQVGQFLAALAEAVEVPRRRVAIVPGDRDINRKACAAYFAEQDGAEQPPVPPFWPKWKHYATLFDRFYADVQQATFTPDEPWSLFEMPDLRVVVAGLNSTMADSHRQTDHVGCVGTEQLRWFADRLASYRERGWLRLAAVHHNLSQAADPDAEALRDVDDVDRLLGATGLVNLLLHGHAHDRGLHRLPSGLVALSTGTPAPTASARAVDLVPTARQYQLVTLTGDGFTRHARRYAAGSGRWIGDTAITATGSDWRDRHKHSFTDVHAVLPKEAPPTPASSESNRGLGESVRRQRARTAVESTTTTATVATAGADSAGEDFLDRVHEATRVRFPNATVTVADAGPPLGQYLRVSNQLPDDTGVEQWPVGVLQTPTRVSVDAFLDGPHARFASADPTVRTEIVHGGPPAPAALVDRARRRGARLRSFVDYQGLLDLRPLADRQATRLAGDQIYPAALYVPQRFRVVDGIHDEIVGDGLLGKITVWLGEADARFVMVLGDFGRGKTALLRQLARTLPDELPGILPVLVELRSLEKAPCLDELLGQHLIRNDVTDVNPKKLQYMIRSGRLALLFDGFDELELRVGYDNATDYLQTLLASVTDRAKVVLTSRTQHFRSTTQIRTALGDRVAGLGTSRVVVLEDFTEDQILAFLTNRFAGNTAAARDRYQLIAEIEDLLGLSRNPRMLAFIAALDAGRLRDIQARHGRISAAELYRELVDFWLVGEATRMHHRRGLPTLDETDRLAACTALATRLWAATALSIPVTDLSAQVSATLTRLAERGYTTDQATHAIGSGSLLVRTDDDAFTFVHQSIMEWLVADAAARHLRAGTNPEALTTRRLSKLMADFLTDLAGPTAIRAWTQRALASTEASQATKQNALQISTRLPPAAEGSDGQAPRIDLTDVDLRAHDLTGIDLRGAILRRADLRGLRLDNLDLTDADLTGARFNNATLLDGSLHGATITGSTWTGAALLGVQGLEPSRDGGLGDTSELGQAAATGRDRAQTMISPGGACRSLDFSPDGANIALGRGKVAEIVSLPSGRTTRVLVGHSNLVRDVAFSPDGTLIATASEDTTARIWDTTTGTTRATLTGHTDWVRGVTFSPDGTLLATASRDGTARIWDTTTGTTRATLTGHTDWANCVAFSPDGALLATASYDTTARIWDTTTGTTRATLTGHTDFVRSVAFSPDGTLLATASADTTARIWDTTTAQTHISLRSRTAWVEGVAFSPDGTLLATTSNDSKARLWDSSTGQSNIALAGHTNSVCGVTFSTDGALVATCSGDRTARIWETVTGEILLTLTGHTDFINAVAFSPDDFLLATASHDGTARIWDTTTGQTCTILTGHTDWVRGVVFSPDGTLIATASNDATARIWDTTTGQTCTILTGHTDWINAVAFSPDGTLIATTSADATARIWDTTTGQTCTILTGHTNWVNDVAFSPDGTLIATTSRDGAARIWDTDTGRTHTVLTGHLGWVTAVAFSPDGTLLATASADATARIWDTSTGAQLVTLLGLADDGYAVLLPDGSYKLSGDAGDALWWAIKLRRFAPGELDPYVDAIRRLPDDAVIIDREPARRAIDLGDPSSSRFDNYSGGASVDVTMPADQRIGDDVP